MQARRAKPTTNILLASLLALAIGGGAAVAEETPSTDSNTTDPAAAPKATSPAAAPKPADPATAPENAPAPAPVAAPASSPAAPPDAAPVASPASSPAAPAAAAPAAKGAVQSPGAALGKPAPDFTLTDTEGVPHHLADYIQEGKTVVLEWFNPDCPFVRKHHQKTDSMKNTYAYCKGKDVVWLAINSGAPGKQGYGLERNRKAIQDYGIQYPLLLDESGVVGKMYGAKTTPDMFVIYKGNLVYEGAIDNNPSPAGDLGDRNYVREAIDACTAGKSVGTAKTRSYGCSVKYAS
jgi:peroxiredoxin